MLRWIDDITKYTNEAYNKHRDNHNHSNGTHDNHADNNNDPNGTNTTDTHPWIQLAETAQWRDMEAGFVALPQTKEPTVSVDFNLLIPQFDEFKEVEHP